MSLKFRLLLRASCLSTQLSTRWPAFNVPVSYTVLWFLVYILIHSYTCLRPCPCCSLPLSASTSNHHSTAHRTLTVYLNFRQLPPTVLCIPAYLLFNCVNCSVHPSSFVYCAVIPALLNCLLDDLRLMFQFRMLFCDLSTSWSTLTPAFNVMFHQSSRPSNSYVHVVLYPFLRQPCIPTVTQLNTNSNCTPQLP